MQILRKILRNIVALPLYFWQALFLIFPLVLLGYREWTNINMVLATLGWLLKSKFIYITLYSFFFAFLTSVCALIIGYLFAYSITSYSYLTQTLLLLFASIPFLSNFLIHATSWICFLENNGIFHKFLNLLGFGLEKTPFLYNQIATIIVLVYCYLPYAILPLYISLEKFNRTLIRASKDLGATPLQTFYKIVIPSSENAIITSFFLVFIPCTSEFIIPQIIGGDRVLYCGSIFSYITMTPTLFALAPTTTALYILLLIIASLGLLFLIKLYIKALN